MVTFSNSEPGSEKLRSSLAPLIFPSYPTEEKFSPDLPLIFPPCSPHVPLILLRRKNFPLIFLHWFMMVRFEIPEKKVQVLKIWNFDTFKTMKLFIALCKNFEIRLIPTQAIWGRGKHKQERKTLPLIILWRKSFPLKLSKGNYVPPIFPPCSSHIQGRKDLTSPVVPLLEHAITSERRVGKFFRMTF